VASGLIWLAPIIAALLAFEYHAIVRWEEGLLEARLGERYRDYMQRVPRWMPRGGGQTEGTPAGEADGNRFTWRQTFFSERGTLLAIAAGYVVLWMKS
jgi:hypothetical protein